jgi:cytochrome c oxidase subunit II
MRRITICMILLGATAAAPLPSNRTMADPTPRVIQIKAKKFEFLPNQIMLKKGETVTLELTSLDRVHGFFQRALGIDGDIEPNQVNRITLTPKESGSYQVICDHYCGYGHGNMNMTINVE